jgi:hypothetical protein
MFFVNFTLTDEFTSLEEPTEVSDFVVEAIFSCRQAQIYWI